MFAHCIDTLSFLLQWLEKHFLIVDAFLEKVDHNFAKHYELYAHVLLTLLKVCLTVKPLPPSPFLMMPHGYFNTI